MLNKIKKVLALYDFHYPHHVDYKAFLKFAKDYKPDEFILGGDMWSLDCISHWNDANFKNVGFDNVRKTLHEEAEGFKKILDEFRKYMPKAKFTYILGNHEDWMKQFTNKYPQMDDMSVEGMLELKKKRINVIPFSGTYKVGEIYFKHGHEFGSENCAKQAVLRCKHTIVFGHHHNHIIWSDYSDIVSEERHLGILVPCFCGRAPEYAKGRPNRWMNGFFYANIKKSGNFSCGVQLVSPKGHFLAQNGKEYK